MNKLSLLLTLPTMMHEPLPMYGCTGRSQLSVNGRLLRKSRSTRYGNPYERPKPSMRERERIARQKFHNSKSKTLNPAWR